MSKYYVATEANTFWLIKLLIQSSIVWNVFDFVQLMIFTLSNCQIRDKCKIQCEIDSKHATQMQTFKVLEYNQYFMSWIGIHTKQLALHVYKLLTTPITCYVLFNAFGIFKTSKKRTFININTNSMQYCGHAFRLLSAIFIAII